MWAYVRAALADDDALDRRGTARAGLLLRRETLQVHRGLRLSAARPRKSASPGPERGAEVLDPCRRPSGRAGRPLPRRRQGIGQPPRMDPRPPQGLVGVDVPQAGDEDLVQSRGFTRRLRGAPFEEGPGGARVERLRPSRLRIRSASVYGTPAELAACRTAAHCRLQDYSTCSWGSCSVPEVTRWSRPTCANARAGARRRTDRSRGTVPRGRRGDLLFSTRRQKSGTEGLADVRSEWTGERERLPRDAGRV